MLLTFNINKQLIKRTDCEIPVAKSENYLYAQFSFTDDWEGTKTAIFGDYSIQLGEDNKCLVPWESIKEPGFSVSVFCGQRVTANVAYVDVLPSGYKEGQTPQPPSPTVYDQILDEIEKRLSAEDVLAGTNVTVTKNADGTITISTSGGGSGDIQIDASLKKVNDVYGIDFTSFDPTDEEAPFDKPNNALSATTLVAVLTKVLSDLKSDFSAAIALKQNNLTAGTGISIVNDVISATLGWSVEVLSELPASGEEQTFYFIAKQDAETGDVYDEYIWINNAFELIGSTQVDLTNYVTLTDLATELLKYYTKTQIDSLLSGKADSFTVGQNLSLSSGVLSAIITGAFKFSNALPPTGTSGALYLIPNGLPSDLVTYVNLAYDKWGSLSSYPYLMWYENNNTKYIQFLTATVCHTDSGYIAGSGSGGSGVSRRTIAVSKLDGTITYSTGSSVNDWTNNIVYSNFDVRQNDVSSGEVYFTANVDSTIDYSSGATIAKTFKGYMWNGTSFDYKGLTDLVLLFEGLATKSELDGKQALLESGINIKTINSTSLLGSGDLAVNTLHNYLTTEQVVGTWIDGRPIYEKTIVWDSYVKNTAIANGVTIDIGESDVDDVRVVEQYFVDRTVQLGTTSSSILPLLTNKGTIPFMLFFNIAIKKLQIETTGASSYGIPAAENIRQIWAVVQYTKTTDTATE